MGLVVTFNNGRSALFSAEFLYAHIPFVRELIESDFLDENPADSEPDLSYCDLISVGD